MPVKNSRSGDGQPFSTHRLFHRNGSNSPHLPIPGRRCRARSDPVLVLMGKAALTLSHCILIGTCLLDRTALSLNCNHQPLPKAVHMSFLQSGIKKTIYQLWADDEGQDLIEYTLLLAFVTLGAAALMRGAGSSVNTVWSSASTTLSNAVIKAS